MEKTLFHRPVLSLIPTALCDSFLNGYYGDKVVEYNLKQKGKKFGSRDRKQFAQIFYDILRWYRKLCVCIGLEEATEEFHFWGLLEAWLIIQDQDVPDWQEFEGFDRGVIQRKWQALNSGAIGHSLPDWLYQLGLDELGAPVWEAQLVELNKKASLIIRTNTLKSTVENLLNLISEKGVDARPVIAGSEGIIFSERQNVFQWDEFKKGFFEVQDYGSQLIAPFVQAESGMRIMDACAGAGGKSLHMASLMKNKGKIISSDIHEWKLKELKKRSRRNGIDIIETRLIDAKLIKRQTGKFDRLLLDVPCSGLGVLKRNPDSKWKLTSESIEHVKKTQKEIISNYSRVVSPGGKMVYSTCSLLPSENRDQVDCFLSENTEWFIEDELNVPVSPVSDGFYMCRLVRK